MVSSTLCPAVHILGSQNVYSRTEGITGHYWPWAVFSFFFPFLFSNVFAMWAPGPPLWGPYLGASAPPPPKGPGPLTQSRLSLPECGPANIHTRPSAHTMLDAHTNIHMRMRTHACAHARLCAHINSGLSSVLLTHSEEAEP